MDNVKFVIIIFLTLAFLFTILAIMSIAFLQKYNKKVSERSQDRRAFTENRRSRERRSAGRDSSDRRSSDRRSIERRLREGSIFDRQNVFENFAPNLTGLNA
jgi:hypothetical protein